MASYRRLKPYFASGNFYGIDEQTHVHADPASKGAVMNCFNLDSADAEREIRFDPAQFRLAPNRNYQFSASAFQRSGDIYVGKVRIPGHGHTLIEIS